MWELLQLIIEEKITPNQLLLLYGLKEKTQVKLINSLEEVNGLIKQGFVEQNENKSYTVTLKGNAFIAKLNTFFVKAKKKTNIQLMGKEFNDHIEAFRNVFPMGKLPSGKPARQNVKALGESFRWFFETYDYTWEEIMKATKMYVNEYRATDYLYMQTSQYFIAKQDKHKVKTSTLSDYCDMIKDGVQTEIHTFKEKVV
jgi:predicted transcriptional regulator